MKASVVHAVHIKNQAVYTCSGAHIVISAGISMK